jgi:hypothetical protein
MGFLPVILMGAYVRTLYCMVCNNLPVFFIGWYLRRIMRM